MVDFKETAFNYIAGDKTGTFFSSENKWVNKIEGYAEKYPDDVSITYKNDDGSILAEIPVKWFKVSPPKKMSEEQKLAASERFKQMWADKQTD